LNELPRRKQRGIKNFKFCHSALDAESSPVFWIPASAGMTNSPQAAGNTTRRDLNFIGLSQDLGFSLITSNQLGVAIWVEMNLDPISEKGMGFCYFGKFNTTRKQERF
jgi:hypothetical protein